MKLFSKTVLTSLLFLTFFTIKSQDTDLLKAFINKNSVALRSIQKTSMKNSDSKNADNFKELLRLHLASVKLYDSNKDQCTAAALKVREGSLDYITKNSNKTTSDFFSMTNEEKTKLNSNALSGTSASYLSDSEIKKIDAVDMMDPSLFNQFTVTLQ